MKKVVLHVRVRIGVGAAAATSPDSMLCQMPSRAATVDARCLAITTNAGTGTGDRDPGTASQLTLH